AAFYGVGVNPLDGTVWGTVLGFPGYVIRLNPGSNPPATALAAVFDPPPPGAARHGHRPHRLCLDAPLQRASRELRPPQVQGAAQRAHRDRAALSGRMEDRKG